MLSSGPSVDEELGGDLKIYRYTSCVNIECFHAQDPTVKVKVIVVVV